MVKEINKLLFLWELQVKIKNYFIFFLFFLCSFTNVFSMNLKQRKMGKSEECEIAKIDDEYRKVCGLRKGARVMYFFQDYKRRTKEREKSKGGSNANLLYLIPKSSQGIVLGKVLVDQTLLQRDRVVDEMCAVEDIVKTTDLYVPKDTPVECEGADFFDHKYAVVNELGITCGFPIIGGIAYLLSQ